MPASQVCSFAGDVMTSASRSELIGSGKAEFGVDMSFWQAIVDADYAVPAGYSVRDLSHELLAGLGSTDAALRDAYAYPILDRWLHQGLYSDNEKRDMLTQLAGNLTMGLGESGADTVFLRAFSVLMLAELVHEDNQRPWLAESEVRQLLELAIVYLEAERDARGWVPAKGWAHATAHTGDLLFVLARNRYLLVGDLERILAAIAAKAIEPDWPPYVYDEDERLAQPVVAALRRGLLSEQFITAWLDRLVNPPDRPTWGETFLSGEAYVPRHNLKLLLRSLYGQLTLVDAEFASGAALLPHLTEALKTFSGWYLHEE